jgi:hypothetical protein
MNLIIVIIGTLGPDMVWPKVITIGDAFFYNIAYVDNTVEQWFSTFFRLRHLVSQKNFGDTQFFFALNLLSGEAA